MKLRLKPLTVATLIAVSLGCTQAQKSEQITMETPAKNNIDIWPKLDIEVKQDPAIEARAQEILAKMTLEQKVAQMIQPEIRDITPEDMRKYGFGSYLNGGGSFPHGNKQATPQEWIDLAESMYQASMDASEDGIAIPTMWGTDAVHGHNNVIGATLFPHNIGLGAMNNPELIEKIAEATAVEVMVTGIDWVFAPTVATARDDRWGRTYEAYSEDPTIVYEYSKAIVRGLQGHSDKDFLADDRVISTVKHFIGDGGTVGGDDQGDNIASEQELFDIHAQGYVGGLTVGAQSVMASFNSWHGKKLHGVKYLLTDVLKDKMGFDGFVVGDWNGHGQIEGCTNDNCPDSVNAGLDIYMVPTMAWKGLYENTIQQVKDGIIAQSRIDDAVTRILRVKLRAGLFEKPSPAKRQFSGKTELIGQESHREVARQAVRESMVLLKNKAGILPVSPSSKVLIAGDGADNIGKQSGGWTITWQGTNNTNADFPGGSSIYDGLKAQIEAAGGSVELSEDGSFNEKPEIAFVVFGEEPYAEGHGDRENLDYQRGNKKDLALLKSLKEQGIPVVSVFISGRPMWVNAEINASDAFVAVWLPGSEGKAVADVLLTDAQGKIQHDFKGRLSFSWLNDPYDAVLNKGDEDYEPLFPYGYGLDYKSTDTLGDDLIETYEAPDDVEIGRVIYKGAPIAPWTLSLVSNGAVELVSAATASFEGVSFRTIDKNVQEDAFRVTTDGTQFAGVNLAAKSYFREDLTAELVNETVLSFALARQTDLSGPLILNMSCESEGDEPGSCTHGVDLTEHLSKAEKGEWIDISIDLACFAEQGIDFTKLVIPFQLVTSGAAVVDVYDVAFTKLEDGVSPLIECK